MNFAVLASGNGSNLQAIIDAVRKKKIKAQLVLVASDRSDAFALKRAQKAGIKSIFVNPSDFPARKDFEAELIRRLEEAKVDFLVLAGFMRILSPEFIQRYSGKVLNVHPSLLPAFKGAKAITDAFEYGAKLTGVTIHFVDEKIDHGPIILQEAIEIKAKETLVSLETRIHKLEHKLYPKAIDLFAKGKLKVVGRKVVIL